MNKKYNYKTVSERECKKLIGERFEIHENSISLIGVDSRCITFQNMLNGNVLYYYNY